MTGRLLSRSLLRDISDVSRGIQMLTGPHLSSPTPEIRSMSTFHLPDVRAPAQHFIDMGLRPALVRHLSSVFMDIVSPYRQVFGSYFCRAIQGSRHLRPEHYRDIFVLLFKGIIQVLGSQFISATWVWLCQTRQPTAFRPQCIDVRVDAVMKVQILSRLGLGTTLSIMDATSNGIELPEGERKTEGHFPTGLVRLVDVHLISKKLPASESLHPPPASTTPPTSDLFHSEKSSTCFPACYPPLLSEADFSPRKALVTQFKLTPSAGNEKSVANCSVDVPSLTAILGKMSVTTPEAGLKTQENRKYVWAPSFKTSEAPPLLSPVTASMSGLPRKSRPQITETISPAKPITTRRKRRIAALPKRQTETAALASVGPPSPLAANPPISRTPSLISDASSCADSPPSSEELDTPPSTPPSHSPPLIACNASPTIVTSSKPQTKGPFGLPIHTNPDFRRPRRGKGIRIDFKNGEAVGKQQFSFTFGA